MMEEQATPARQMSCFKCGFQAITSDVLCPRCKRKLQTSTSIRVRGVVLIFCGIFLVAFMSYLSAWMLKAFNNTDALHARFNGTHEQMLMIVALFSLIILFGFISLITGLYQTILGRRNKLFVWTIAGLGLLVFLAANYFIWTAK